MDGSIMMKHYSIFLIVLITIMAGSALAERLTIIAPVANIRSGPDKKSDILWKVEKYYPIGVCTQISGWQSKGGHHKKRSVQYPLQARHQGENPFYS